MASKLLKISGDLGISDTMLGETACMTGVSLAEGVEARLRRLGRLPSVHLLGCLKGFLAHRPVHHSEFIGLLASSAERMDYNTFERLLAFSSSVLMEQEKATEIQVI